MTSPLYQRLDFSPDPHPQLIWVCRLVPILAWVSALAATLVFPDSHTRSGHEVVYAVWVLATVIPYLVVVFALLPRFLFDTPRTPVDRWGYFCFAGITA